MSVRMRKCYGLIELTSQASNANGMYKLQYGNLITLCVPHINEYNFTGMFQVVEVYNYVL
jgi:hypothetical protein